MPKIYKRLLSLSSVQLKRKRLSRQGQGALRATLDGIQQNEKNTDPYPFPFTVASVERQNNYIKRRFSLCKVQLLFHFMDTIEESANGIEKAYEFE